MPILSGGEPSLALFTDLYELTMLQAYFEEGMDEEAAFSLFVRRLPAQRNFLLSCGLEDALRHLESLSFDRPALDYLAGLGIFSDRFLRHLEALRFTGDVYAIAEGTPVFANEPLLEVVAPLPQAQLVETVVMNQIHLQTLLASKAVRVVLAARGRAVVDFGLRRMHGLDAGLKAARAFHIAGVQSTSNVAAGQAYGVPVSGTMAHSYVQAHEDEYRAFRAFARIYPDTVLLVDTYDTAQGVRRVTELARELGEQFQVRAVRLDSGDLAELAKQARRILDRAGLERVQIFASGSLDERAIAQLLRQGAPVDGFGVGTKMGVSEDAPSLDIAYKLVSYGGYGRMKLSTGKPVFPGRKQVFRIEEGGTAVRDVLAGYDERRPGRPLLSAVMKNGERLSSGADLDTIRRYAEAEIAILPERLRELEACDPPYPVEISAALQRAREQLATRLTR